MPAGKKLALLTLLTAFSLATFCVTALAINTKFNGTTGKIRAIGETGMVDKIGEVAGLETTSMGQGILEDQVAWQYTQQTPDYTASFAVTQQQTIVKLQKANFTAIFSQNLQNPTLQRVYDKDSQDNYDNQTNQTGQLEKIQKTQQVHPKYIFTDTVTNTQYVYHITPQGLKEDIIFSSRPTALFLPLTVQAPGLIMQFDDGGKPVFYDSAMQEQFHLEAPWAKDAKGSQTTALFYAQAEPSKDPSVNNLSLVLDTAWFADPARVYPVIVDPIVFFRGINLRGVNVNRIPPTTCTAYTGCGEGFDITCVHTKYNGVAPVAKTVIYKTVQSNLTGTNMCWLAQNLGATDQASSATDNDEDSAGWYFQFNRKQGFKHTTTRTPATTWIPSISESANWADAQNPCKLELGTDWRLPTSTEWQTADANGEVGGWDNYNETYASPLKLHATGYIDSSSGALANRGSFGSYWSSTQHSATNGYYLSFASGNSNLSGNSKARGFPVRCLRNL